MRAVLAAVFLLAFGSGLSAAQTPAAAAAPVTVFAAASLTDALKDIDKIWQQAGHPAMRMSFAASSTLARQIEQGAPADLFISADEQWMDWADQHKLIRADTRRDLLGNSLVLVAAKDHATPVSIGPGFDVLALLGSSGRLAVGDPSNVPAGIYAKQALTRLNLWDAVQPHLASSDSVRSALLLVERGEAPAGVVYSTDAAVSPGVAIIGTFPENTHDPITYPFAATTSGNLAAAKAALEFFAGPAALAGFRARGFVILGH